jgi:hypothetical protein
MFSRFQRISLAILVGLWLIFTGITAQSAGAENYEKQTLIEADFSGQVLTDSEFVRFVWYKLTHTNFLCV